MNARERLAELERDFNAPHATMCLPDYLAERERLLREADDERDAPPPAPAAPAPAAPVAVKDMPITSAVLTRTMAIIGKNTKEAIDRAITKELEPVGSRLAAVENRTGAISMMLARSGSSAELVKTYEAGLARLVQIEAHVARLEGAGTQSVDGVSRAEIERALLATGKAVRASIDKATAPLMARIAELQAKLDAASVARESLERRASRHAEHLARLESRLKAIETK